MLLGWNDSVVKCLKGSAFATVLGYGGSALAAIGYWLSDKMPKIVHGAMNVVRWLHFKTLWLGAVVLGIVAVFYFDIGWLGRVVFAVFFIGLPICVFVKVTLLPIVRMLRQPKLQEFEFSESAADPENLFRIIHISDIHITGVEGAKTHTQMSFVPSELKHKLDRMRELNADAIVVTGDITDSGDQPAWDLFSDYFCESGLDTPTILIPGNHDLVLSTTLQSDLIGAQVQLQICRFLKALHRVLTFEFRSVQNSTGAIVSSKNLLAKNLSFIEDYLEISPQFPGGRAIDVSFDFDRPLVHGTPLRKEGRDFRKPQRILEEIYPLALPANKELLIVALDSIQHEDSALFFAENAIGFIKSEQFERLRHLVSHYGPSSVVICLHHPPGVPKVGLKSAFLHLQNSPKLLAICKEINCKLILYGHTHSRRFSRIKNVQVVCSGASIENPTSNVIYLLDRGRIVNIMDYL